MTKKTNVQVPLSYIISKGIWHVNNPLYLIDKTLRKFDTDTYHIDVRGEQRMLTQNATFINHVLQKNHKNYEKSRLATEIMTKYSGNGVLVTNGKEWLKQRRLLQPGFHKKKINKLIADMNDQILIDLDKLKTKIRTGQNKVDVLEELARVTLKVVSRGLFSFDIDEDQMQILQEGFKAMQDSILSEAQFPILYKFRKASGKQNRADQKIKAFYEFIKPIIQERKSKADPPEDLLTMLLESRYEGTDEGMSDQQILDELVVFFIAGFETSTNALTFILYLLTKNPQHISIIDDEIINNPMPQEPSTSDVMSLKYITQVINESMRLFPSAWFLDRVAIEEEEINGEKIAKGELLALYTFGLHRSPEYWQEPTVFDPDRFSDENKSKIVPHTFIPFGGGPRLCIGAHFAMMEMSLVVYHFIRLFKFTLQDDFELALEAKLTLRPKNGMPMILETR